MKIVCLVENTKGPAGCAVEHGLSYYIETEKHRILMDTGASDLVLENAEKLGVDLSRVDIAFLSHGHHDHGGGIPGFVQVNDRAKIYLQRSAIGKFYSDEFGGTLRYIGLSEETCGLSRLEFVDGDLEIDEELYILSGIGQEHPLPSGCLRQRMMGENGPVQDD